MCVVLSSHLFWTSSSLDIPAGVTQGEGHTGFLIHLPSAVRAFIFLARRVQPFLPLVDREVGFCEDRLLWERKYQNGPNPFFYSGPKIWSGQLLWERKTYTKMDQIDTSGCVFCVFFPFILDIKFVGRTRRSHTGGRSPRISHPPSFCGACLIFSREKDSAIPFPRRL